MGDFICFLSGEKAVKKKICLLLLFTTFFLFSCSPPALAGGLDKEALLKGLGLTLVLLLIINLGQESWGESRLQEGEMILPLTHEELDLLQRIIQAEAGGEPYRGKVAVGAVVLNRIKSPLFPNSLQAVLFEENQFEPVRNRRLFSPPNQDSKKAAREALQGVDPSGGALYFYNRQLVLQRGDLDILAWFDNHTTVTTIIGNHTFAR